MQPSHTGCFSRQAATSCKRRAKGCVWQLEQPFLKRKRSPSKLGKLEVGWISVAGVRSPVCDGTATTCSSLIWAASSSSPVLSMLLHMSYW